jgi:hypothetical protein
MATKKLKLKEVIVKHRGRVIFRQYVPKKTKLLSKIYKGYMCAMKLDFGWTRTVTDDITATQ